MIRARAVVSATVLRGSSRGDGDSRYVRERVVSGKYEVQLDGGLHIWYVCLRGIA